MRILVTGGAGFIGSHLVRFLLDQARVSVLNVDKLTYASHPDALADLVHLENYSFEQVDLLDAADLVRVLNEYKPDAIMHLAAESHVDRSIEDADCFVSSNIIGTFRLLEATLDFWNAHSCPSSFRFLHVSTDEVYGSLDADTPKFTESSVYDPHSPYAATKAASDHLVSAWSATYGLPVILTHGSNNYGPYQFPEKLIPLVISKCLEGGAIPVYGDGANIRDWLHVEDHVEALWAVLNRGRVGETYNIGGDNELANIDLVRTICRTVDVLKPSEFEHEELIEFVEDRRGHDARYAVDSRKIQSELDWAPVREFTTELRRTIEWYLCKHDGGCR